MTQAACGRKRPDDGIRALLSRLGVLAAALTGLAALGLLAAGCGASGSPAVANVSSTTTTVANDASKTTATATAGGASRAGGSPAGGSSVDPRGGGNHTVMMVANTVQGTKFAACMRAHALPNFPDPSPLGTIQFGSGIDPHSPVFRSALSACRKLLPAGFGPPTAAQRARLQQQLLAFSTCMRTHGIENFPDPTGVGLPQIQPVGNLDPNNPQFQAADNACKAQLPPGVPSKALGGLAPPAAPPNSGGG